MAEMSRDLIEHGLGWSWTRERVLRSLRHPRHQRRRRRARRRAGRLRHHEIRRRGSAPAAARGQPGACAARRRPRPGRLAGSVGAGRRRRPHHARGALRQRRGARLLRSPRLCADAAPARLLRRPRGERAHGQGVRRRPGAERRERVATARRARRGAAWLALAAGAASTIQPLPLAAGCCRRAARNARSGVASAASRKASSARRGRLRVASACRRGVQRRHARSRSRPRRR